ncbi:MAG: PilX N-terminal domain-containing pilus assembly protein [Pedobacter sp.]|nr:PilX N-terminal domain-containing pilus assembly protein [Pedobacter sp.]
MILGATMKNQSGIALFVCLVILLLLSLLGISAMRMMTSQNMIAASSQGADIVFDAAETGINKAIVDAQAAAKANGVKYTAMSPVASAPYPSDDKGITTVSVDISVPVDASPAARQRILEARAEAGAFGTDSVTPTFVRFTSTATVDALDIKVSHTQDTLVFSM